LVQAGERSAGLQQYRQHTAAIAKLCSIDPSTSSTIVALSATQAKHAQKLASLAQETARMQQLQESTHAEVEAHGALLQQHQAAQTAALANLEIKLNDSQAKIEAAVRMQSNIPLVQMSIDQAHCLCCALLPGIPLEYATFQANGTDGNRLTQYDEGDLFAIFGLEPIGLRHRLLYYVHHASPQLLEVDFAAEVAKLQAWLSQQDNVSPEHVELVGQAQFDMVTCHDLGIQELRIAGIPPAARKPLLMLLHDVPLESSSTAAGTGHPWSVTEQRVVLDRVLQENAELAGRLKQQGARAAKTVPDEYLCPITCEVMDDPVMAEDGHTYERAAIATWVASDGTSPITRQQMPNRLIPNKALKAGIARWSDETGQ
jgi:hypothetical protein